jgi:hypothetical protein
MVRDRDLNPSVLPKTCQLMKPDRCASAINLEKILVRYFETLTPELN